MSASVAQALASTLSADAAQRAAATEQLESLERDQYRDFVHLLSTELANDAQQSHIRNAAGVSIGGVGLGARDALRRDELANRWRSGIEASVRTQAKNNAVIALSAADRGVRSSAAQVIAAIAAVEVPAGLWPDLISALLGLVRNESNPGLRQATLQTIGFVCEQVKPKYLSDQSNQILTAVVQGMRKEETDPDVQLAAVNALYNSLEFVRSNFETDVRTENPLLLTFRANTVCEATQAASPAVQASAFGCLVRIMDLYYDKMKFYMERALFGLTVMGMRNADENVALQAIEFWSTVCDSEIDLALESEELADLDEAPERESQHFARIGLPEALPVLLELLTKQDEDATEDEWNVAMAAGTCLGLFAQAVGDAIVTPIVPFVERNIRSTDWHQREAAVLAFGSILDGPEPKLLTSLVTQALPTLIEMVRDPSVHVRDTAAWTLGRISDLHIGIIDLDIHLPALVGALVAGLGEGQRVASNCCWALMNLAEQLGNASAQTCPLSPYYEGVIQALLGYAERGEPNARTSAYETASAFVAHAPADALPVVSTLVVSVVSRAESALALQNQIVGADERNSYNELQTNLCGLLTAIIRRLGRDAHSLADRVMTLLLQLIQTSSKQSPVLEDAFLCVGALAAALDDGFRAYAEAFMPFLHSALQSYAEYQLYAIAVGLIGDICRALGPASAPYCRTFMEALLAGLQAGDLHRSVKPTILSCFGDIAMAIGGEFEPFVIVTVGVLQQASAMRADAVRAGIAQRSDVSQNNYDMIEYVNQLREGVLEAFTGIVAAMKAGGKGPSRCPDGLILAVGTLQPAAQTILSVLHLCLTDQNRSESTVRAAIGLRTFVRSGASDTPVGDLADAFPDGSLKAQLSTDWVSDALRIARSRSGGGATGGEIRKLAKWAATAVKRATS